MVEISTSILSLDKEESVKKIYDLEVAHTDYFHIDVMDGQFVENDTREKMNDFANAIKHVSNIPLDVHLMVEDVKTYIEEYVALMPNVITFHYEAAKNKEEVMELINYIKENNVKVGLAIKPNTKVEEIYEFLSYIHMLLIMTVEPGKGGQKLIVDTLDKVRNARKFIEDNNLDIDIEVDGGINLETMKEVKETGIDIAVVGSGILNTVDYKKTISELKRI